MKAIIFGGSGFLGSHVADALTKSGYNVTIFDKCKSKYLQKNQKIIIGDILDEDTVEESVKNNDIVYNFAAISDINDANINPVETVKYNILGNTIILNVCKLQNIKRFVFASSLYVYSNAGAFYRSSKQSCELIIENFNELYNLPYTILRYGSLYGPRSNEKNYIHKIIKQCITENKITSLGKADDIRNYIHVFDAARYSVDILSKEFENEYVTLTGNESIKRKELLIMIKEILGDNINIEFLSNNSVSHYSLTPYSFDLKIAKKFSGNSHIDLGQGLLQCINEIYKEYKVINK